MSHNADITQIEVENKVRDIMIKEWDNIAKKQPKLVNYLKNNIHIKWWMQSQRRQYGT